ncbi:hypothetical protein FC50_GL001152 [Lacticaseibacillus pantheris DSM 15945 = JCM 12539 = NBRC 106106]|uniref:Uncharacterized protein n=2 Tax=Lacticaseibacillus pantheris TaxID=171523 RepID=A0A0R1U483_9LACO|nr:hypothetical protein FC50_GL001152 [Lacticaseibacillus pantheris DSM 15945 = JCM 12539 = NBRC 106106]
MTEELLMKRNKILISSVALLGLTVGANEINHLLDNGRQASTQAVSNDDRMSRSASASSNVAVKATKISATADVATRSANVASQDAALTADAVSYPQSCIDAEVARTADYSSTKSGVNLQATIDSNVAAVATLSTNVRSQVAASAVAAVYYPQSDINAEAVLAADSPSGMSMASHKNLAVADSQIDRTAFARSADDANTSAAASASAVAGSQVD